jgi:biopolymer transport protein ExbD
MSIQAASGSGPTAHINVTPMADIMIVLLIIFMVTTPLITGSGVVLPAAAHGQARARPPIVLVLGSDRALAIEGSAARDLGAVSSEIRARLDEARDGSRVVYLKADARLAYSAVRPVMELLRELGADQVALATSARLGV